MLLGHGFLFSLWVVLWIARLFSVPLYYIRTQALGYYPVHADSIGIPIAGNVIITLLIGPFIAWFLWVLLRGSPGDRSWFAWCRPRPVASLAWTLLFAALALHCLASLRDAIAIDLPLNAVADACWAFLWLAMRSVMVSRLFVNPATR